MLVGRPGVASGAVQRPIIDGDRWIRERLRFLRARLEADDLSPDDRRAAEAEVDTLAKERGLSAGWWQRSGVGWWRRLRR